MNGNQVWSKLKLRGSKTEETRVRGCIPRDAHSWERIRVVGLKRRRPRMLLAGAVIYCCYLRRAGKSPPSLLLPPVRAGTAELSILLLLKPALPIRTYTGRYGQAVQSLVEVARIFAPIFWASAREGGRRSMRDSLARDENDRKESLLCGLIVRFVLCKVRRGFSKDRFSGWSSSLLQDTRENIASRYAHRETIC